MKDLKTPEFLLDCGELQELFRDLSLDQTHIGIRLRLEGQGWSSYFFQVLLLTKSTLMLVHMPSRTLLHIPDLANVYAFQLSDNYKKFAANSIYAIRQNYPPLKASADGLFYA